MAKNSQKVVEKTTVKTVEVEPAVKTEDKKEEKGFFLKGAEWLLSRLPWFKYKYLNWTKTKRIVVGYLMWLIVLPIIPIVVTAILYARDPQGFKKSPMFPVMSAIIIAWLGAFGWVASQSPVTDGTSLASVKEQSDGEKEVVNDSKDAVASDAAKQKIAKQKSSKATNGKKFKNCTDAFEQGVFDIKRNDKSYERRLDRDNDGIACEK